MPIITLTTDFGLGSPYVAAMKGAILGVCPQATIVDITHAVPPQDVRRGALVLEEFCPGFPAGTIHVAVVDPGVGTGRAILCVRMGGMEYIGPDNGLLSALARRRAPDAIIRLENRGYWRAPLSATFHGRDIMAPAAAYLAGGLDPAELGPRQPALVMLDWPVVRRTPRRLVGEVLASDSFGNLITNIEAGDLAGLPPEQLTIDLPGLQIEGLSRTYGEHPAGTLVALLGSGGRLEIAVVNGSAEAELNLRPGDEIVVRLPRPREGRDEV